MSEASEAPSDEHWPIEGAAYVADAVVRLERAIVHIGNIRLRPWNMTLSSYTALRVVARRPNLSLVQLARRCFVTPQTMTRVVSGLEQRGYVERVPNPDSDRALSLCTTASGATALTDMDIAVNQLGPTVNAVLDQQQIAQLDTMLRRCAQAIENEISQL